VIAALLGASPMARAQHGASASNMALVGHHDLQGRSAYQPFIKESRGRWIAYIGHHGGATVNALTGATENNGTSLVDVTDPRRPRYLAHIPGEPGQAESGGAQMVRVCNGSELPAVKNSGDKSKVYMLRNFGNQAHELWDVTTPEKPARIAIVVDQLKDTHKSWWECDSGIAYLVSGLPDWRVRRMTQVFDLSDPAHPRFIRNFGLVGQQPGASGPAPTELHGMVSTGAKGNRIYFGYGTNKSGVLQIVDRQKLISGPAEPTPANLLAPQVGRFDMNANNGAHTTLPVPGVQVTEFARDKDGGKRDIVVVVDESLANECTEPRQMVWIVDATDEKTPVSIATYTVPESSGNFCARGGRFGSHSSNESMAPVYYKKLAFIAFFNAGVRALDIRDPYHPTEVGYFIPSITAATDKRCITLEGAERCKVAIQTNNVETDERGFIYIVDRANTGLHILELTGPAAAAAGLP